VLVRTREETELSINNYGETLPIISDISIVHAVPLIAKNGNPYNIPLWDYTSPVYEYIHDRLADKTSRCIITNPRYNMEKIQPYYEASVYVVNPPVATTTYFEEQKNGRILTVARISPNKNLQQITKIANRTHRNKFIIAGKTEQNSEKVLRVLREMRNIDVRAHILSRRISYAPPAPYHR
jgi:glycosyltransferase involved in cell wall biosynthesis